MALQLRQLPWASSISQSSASSANDDSQEPERLLSVRKIMEVVGSRAGGLDRLDDYPTSGSRPSNVPSGLQHTHRKPTVIVLSDDEDDDSQDDLVLNSSPTPILRDNPNGILAISRGRPGIQVMRTRSILGTSVRTAPKMSLRSVLQHADDVLQRTKDVLRRSNYEATARRSQNFEDSVDFSFPAKSEAEQKQLTFIARAILKEAFLVQEVEPAVRWGVPDAFDVIIAAAQKQVKAKKSRLGIEQFKPYPKETTSVFPANQMMPDKRNYINTASMPFDACVWPSSDPLQRRYMQCINFQSTYENFSLEELRFGDYLWGRVTAPHRFSLFAKLPAELRAMIWGYCCSFARTVELRYGMPHGRPRSPTPHPAMLQVSQESRKYALKHYELAFRVEPFPCQIYFNFDVDTLYLAWLPEDDYGGELEDILLRISQDKLDQVKFLGMDVGVFEFMRYMWQDEIQMNAPLGLHLGAPQDTPEFGVLSKFNNLKTLALVTQFGDEEHNWGHYCECGCDGFSERLKVDNTFTAATAKSIHVGPNMAGKFSRCLKDLSRLDKDWQLPILQYVKKTGVARKK